MANAAQDGHDFGVFARRFAFGPTKSPVASLQTWLTKEPFLIAVLVERA